MLHKSILAAGLMLVLFSACKKDDDGGNPVTPNEVAKEVYPLPGATFFPEGIAYNAQTGHFYTGSVTNGDVLKVDVVSGAASLWASGAAQGRRAATGMKFDAKDRLWVCGGDDAKVSVMSPSGGLLKLWDLKAMFGAAFVNDCISDGDYMYFTDSRAQKIYRAPVGADELSGMEEWLSFSNAEIPYDPAGTNTNGIVSTQSGGYLIVVVSSSGKLYRIRKDDKTIREITLNMPVTAGDGLLLEGTKLYISRNAQNAVYPVTLSTNYEEGTVGTPFGAGLNFNTTMARAGKYLLVVNGQLNRRATGNPVLPFSVSRITTP